jgi:hypothetical protein
MALLGAQYVVALEPSSVAGAAVSRGLGPPRIRSLARAPLAPGALEVSPFEPNVRRADEVRAALAHVASALGMRRSRTCVVLPDGVARLVLLEVPGDASAEEYARFKLSGALAYPAEEALVDVLPVGGSRVVAAAVRRPIVEDFEGVVRAAGLVQDRVDLAPLAAMAALGRAGSASSGVDLILGETALSLAVRLDGAVRAFRNRRRDASPGEPERLRLEVARTAALAGDGDRPARVRVIGPGAAALVRAWREEGGEAELAWRVAGPSAAPDPAELAWLGAALA